MNGFLMLSFADPFRLCRLLPLVGQSLHENHEGPFFIRGQPEISQLGRIHCVRILREGPSCIFNVSRIVEVDDTEKSGEIPIMTIGRRLGYVTERRDLELPYSASYTAVSYFPVDFRNPPSPRSGGCRSGCPNWTRSYNRQLVGMPRLSYVLSVKRGGPP